MIEEMASARSFFESRLKRYGYSPRTLDWSPEGQRKRFEVLLQIGDVNHRDIIDVGCGLGHLLDFLRKKSTSVSYRGFDLSPKLVCRARQEHPGVSFEVIDATERQLPAIADFVFASGVLNLEMGNNDRSMRSMIRSMFRASLSGVGVNMLSTWADWRVEKRHYYDPVKMVRFARGLTRSVVFRHDYLPHDFTLYLFHESGR